MQTALTWNMWCLDERTVLQVWQGQDIQDVLTPTVQGALYTHLRYCKQISSRMVPRDKHLGFSLRIVGDEGSLHAPMLAQVLLQPVHVLPLLCQVANKQRHLRSSVPTWF